MTLTVNLPPATIEKLQVRAAASGKDVDSLIREAVEEKLTDGKRSFLEIMAPVHEEFRKSGMTANELDVLINEVVAGVRAERRASRTQP